MRTLRMHMGAAEYMNILNYALRSDNPVFIAEIARSIAPDLTDYEVELIITGDMKLECVDGEEGFTTYLTPVVKEVK